MTGWRTDKEVMDLKDAILELLRVNPNAANHALLWVNFEKDYWDPYVSDDYYKPPFDREFYEKWKRDDHRGFKEIIELKKGYIDRKKRALEREEEELRMMEEVKNG